MKYEKQSDISKNYDKIALLEELNSQKVAPSSVSTKMIGHIRIQNEEIKSYQK